MLKDKDMCPVCDKGIVNSEIVDEVINYKGEQYTQKGLKIYKCEFCKEEFVDNDSSDSHEKEVRDFHRRVDGLLTSDEIRGIRGMLGLTQKKFSKILGVGANAFQKYEKGTVTQSKGMDISLRFIRKHPVKAMAIIDPDFIVPIKKEKTGTLYSFNRKKKNKYYVDSDKEGLKYG